MTVTELSKETKNLSPSDKRELLETLLEDLYASPNWVNDDEVHERVRQLESGEVQEISLEELKQGLGK